MSAAGTGIKRAPSAGLAVAAVVAILALASCAEKITTVDPGAVPEGARSMQNALVMWHEIPNKLFIFNRGNVDPDCPASNTHVLVDSVTVTTRQPGWFHGVILDSTAASAYQIYRSEPNGGFRTLFDFEPVATRRWFDRGWEIYHFVDPDTAFPSRAYLGRGAVGGSVTIASPLTNEASRTLRAVPNLNYLGPTGFNQCAQPVALDSLFPMSWQSVPNAVAYIIHVYQPSFNLVQLEEQIASGMPAPLFIGKSLDILVAYMPAPNPPTATVSFRMPAPGARPPEARVMTVRQTRYGQEYVVRIAAVDALGQLLAFTHGSFSQELTGDILGFTLPNSQFAVYRVGGAKVVPSRAVPAPALVSAPDRGPARP